MFRIALNIFAAGLVGAALILQDYVLARNFGISAAQDFYQLSYLIASNLWNVLSGGTYLAVAVPLLMSVRARSGSQIASQINLKIFVYYLLVASAVSILGYFIFKQEILRSAATDIAVIEKIAVIQLFAFSIIIHLIASFFSAKIISLQLNFAATSSSALIYIAIPVWYLFDDFTLTQAALVTCIGLISYLVVLIVLNYRYRPAPIELTLSTSKNFVDEAVWPHAIELFKIIVSSLLIALLNWLISAEYAKQGEGEVSKFLYASKPSVMLAAFLTTVIANQLLASFSAEASSKNYFKLKHDVFRAWKITLLACLLFIIGWYLFNDFFYRQMFSKSSVADSTIKQISFLSNIVVLQLPLYMVGVIAWRGLNALSHNAVIIKASFVAIIVFYTLKTLLPLQYEHRLLLVYLSTYFFWSAYLAGSLIITMQTLTRKT